ncbi:hypothetical protein DFJ43DRAFT_1081666 [Lentinula guzmanii]|uniref:Secreted protein n=1 Tax=Lentinula guzmanii TaxID=2804957 RepID=A0AA38J7J3_9AGAR|nr:hypothetical protein DFJ43DRAFT_1081666 [Lentinula guzmanii]
MQLFCYVTLLILCRAPASPRGNEIGRSDYPYAVPRLWLDRQGRTSSSIADSSRPSQVQIIGAIPWFESVCKENIRKRWLIHCWR